MYASDAAQSTKQTKIIFAFVCLHGSAKSLIAAEYLTRMARDRGLNCMGTTSGPEPDAEIPDNVVAGLRARGIDVQGCKPVLVSADALARADHIISFGYDLAPLAPNRRVENWGDCPAVSDDFDTAWTFITGRIDRLLNSVPQGRYGNEES
jgi:arsenate reductase (thioredoxin)